MAVENIDRGKLVNHGIGLCRRGRWREGLRYLKAVAGESDSRELPLPGKYYSFAGYGIAYCEARYKEGLELCKHSVKLEFYDSENYYYLAKTYALRGTWGKAFQAINQGLRVDPENRGLLRLRNRLDRRRPPVLPFLLRANPLNRNLGRVRHALRPKPRLIPSPSQHF